jgi:hypothetical protein
MPTAEGPRLRDRAVPRSPAVRPTGTRRVAVLAGLGGLLFGYDTGVIGGAQLFIQKDFHLSSFSDEVLVSCVLAGAIVGSLASGALLARWGRRPTIIFSGALFLLGSLAAAAAPGAGFLDAARIVVGVANGLVSVSAPLYVAEMAPAERRGSLVSIYQLAITIGILRRVPRRRGVLQGRGVAHHVRHRRPARRAAHRRDAHAAGVPTMARRPPGDHCWASASSG